MVQKKLAKNFYGLFYGAYFKRGKKITMANDATDFYDNHYTATNHIPNGSSVFDGCMLEDDRTRLSICRLPTIWEGECSTRIESMVLGCQLTAP